LLTDCQQDLLTNVNKVLRMSGFVC